MKKYKPSAKNVFKNSFWVLFDNLGKSVAFNLLFLICCIPIITIPAAFAGLMHATRSLIEKKFEEKVRINEYVNGIKKYWTGYSVYFFCLLLILGIALINVMFYLERPGFFTYILNGWTLILIILSITVSLFIPTLLLLRKEITSSVKTAVILVFTNIGFSITCIIIIALITAISLLALVPFFLFMFTLISLFLNFSYMEVIARYNGKPPSYAKDRSIVKEFLVPPHIENKQ